MASTDTLSGSRASRPRPEAGASRLGGWAMAVLAAIGLSFTTLLLMHSLGTGAALPGCGSGGGCHEVLASRWARWLGMPVVAPALVVYGLALLGSLAMTSALPRAVKRGVAAGLLPVSLLAMFAGLWFVYLQLGVVEALCPYCLVVDGTGIALGLVSAWTLTGRGPRSLLSTRAGLIGVFIAAVMATGLIGGQALMAPEVPAARYTAGEVDRADYPLIGSRDAAHELVLLADYTCPNCRALHRALDSARQRYEGRLAFRVAPTTLDAACNPHVETTPARHETGCELAELALAVWRVDETKFPAMDRWLVATDKTRSVEAAREKAASLVGEQALERAMVNNGAWREAFLRAQAGLSHRLGKSAGNLPAGSYNTLPKLLLPDGSLVVGWPGTEQRLIRELSRMLELGRPAQTRESGP